ncbi:MAG TPA: winged helix DNA-binding domain-containing protein [Streptosporangiaceae bacterium]|nr:winged helix DNA-binding domain-containing protein [Streptosporangiaceae bacterium]
MYRIDAAERRRRLAVRHGLGPVAGRLLEPAAVARQLVALHGTDPATVYLSLRSRTAAPVTPAAIEQSLYERRDLVRMLAMRRTVFVVPAESRYIVQLSTTDKIARDQRALLLRLLSQAGTVADPATWLADVERSVLRILADRGGEATAAELSAAEPRLKTTVLLGAGKPYQATQAITSRVLLVLAAHGQIVRGRPVGSWLSQQYRWALTEQWLGARGAAAAEISEASARTELAGQWLTAFGPAPLSDLKWWTGWTLGQVRQAAKALDVAEVDLGDRTGVALPADLAATPEPGDWVALLPALDPTVMGWQDRSWFLGPHGQALFDTNGNAGPTIWLNGQVVGGWAQRASGEIAVRLLADVGADARALVDAEAARLGAWLGDVRVRPRFRTPTERELSGF